MNQQFTQQDSKQTKEGEVHFTNTSKPKSHNDKNQLGDYVDFEEIKEDKPDQ